MSPYRPQERSGRRVETGGGGCAAGLARREFLAGAGLSMLAAGIAGIPAIVWSRSHPAVVAELLSRPVERGDGALERRLILLDDAPVRAETPLDLLDQPITPAEAHFFQGAVPSEASTAWALAVDGLVARSVTLETGAVPHAFPVVSAPLVIECGANGCAAFGSEAGPHFTHGGVGNALWTGVRLRDVLAAAGLLEGAAGLVAESRDGSTGPVLPLSKALDTRTLLAFGMGGAPLEVRHGAPLRLVVPGWPEAYSRKWVTRLRVVSEAGVRAPLSVKSIVTAPLDGTNIRKTAEVRGAAWAGDRGIARVDLSTDFGVTWQAATLDRAAGPHAWRRWRGLVGFQDGGYSEIWARATDSAGITQPLIPDEDSARNNAIHRVWVMVA